MRIFRQFVRMARNTGKSLASEHVALFPAAAALRKYSFEKLREDSRAASNVTLLAVSQAIAFAAIAGLPVVYGVLCTAVAALVAPLFAASRHTIMGPTNATALMLFSFFAANPDLAGAGMK
jgi:sulfate permease, SulP family